MSLISPLFEPAGDSDTNEPNWIPSWSAEEFQQMQREDKSVKFILILESKLERVTIQNFPKKSKQTKSSRHYGTSGRT